MLLVEKEKGKTNPSPIKTISVEKITIPFTFERTYCRIGVVTDDSGIERMEAYFVRNDKTAISYKMVHSVKLLLMTQNTTNMIIVK